MTVSTYLKSILKTLPKKPGVYHFYNNKKEIIYIGKAKSLKKRVSSYFTKNHKNLKTKNLIRKTVDINCIIVETEIDALLLENNLIKKHQPRYNILLKDDKTYPWICIKKEKVPRIFQTRNIVNDGSEYYGPYQSTYIINLLMDFFSELFYDSGLTPDSYVNRRLSVNDKEKYQQTIVKIRKILRGGLRPVINHLEKKMMAFSDNLDFENAQKTKEKITLLDNYQAKSTVVSSKIKNIDVFAICSEKKFAFVNYLKIQNGAVVVSHTVEVKKKLEEKDEDILHFVVSILRQRFNSTSKTILCSHKIKSVWAGVKVILPIIGDKKKLLDLSIRNAKYMRLEKKKHEIFSSEQKEKSTAIYKLKDDLNLKLTPLHIECFDNSNLNGTNPVAACVVFKNGKPCKKEYRIFNIKTVTGADDYKSMEEVIYRRYKRALVEKKTLPQLIIVDGGRGQLSSAIKSLKKLNLVNKISIIGIAKKLETIYFSNDSTPLYLNKRSQGLKLIQRLRNEAHRFAINHHRKKRTKDSLVSSLDNIKGIGSKTSNLLISHFGSIKKASSAKKSDLVQLIGKSKTDLFLRKID